MFIKFSEVTARNFMSIGNSPVTFKLDTASKNMIIGKNGAGKSVVQELISFVLFGVPYRKINKGKMVNDINGKNCECQIRFEIGTKQYRIERNIKPDSLKIYEDEVLLPQLATVKEYQESLERDILKINYSAFCQMNIIGSMGYIPFLKLKANERRAFIESILDLQLFSTMNKSLKTLVSTRKTEQTTANNNLVILNNNIKTYEQIIKDLEQNNDKKIQEIEAQISTKKKEYLAASATVAELEKQFNAIQVKGDDEVRGLQTQISKAQSEIGTAKNENAKLETKIKFFDTTPECQTCGQVIDAAHKQKHLDEYAQTIADNNKLIEANTHIVTTLNQSLSEISVKKSEKQAVESKLNSAKINLEYIKKDAVRLAREKTSLENQDDSTLNNTKNSLVEANEKFAAQQEICDKFLIEMQTYDIMLAALKDSGAKAEIIKKYIPVITKTVNDYLDKLGLFVKFELDENFEEVLKSRHTSEFTYDSFSMGERMRIDIALLFTWREIIKFRTGIDTNLVFFDEVLEILDQEGFEQLLHIVDLTPKLNCFIITHKTGLDHMFNNVVEVKKEKGFTVIASQ
jgi:DNA repair exonuclease SbcCD ATPase subunit